ncbi:hypothetical protein SD304_13915 [Staphylococcus nepalensis]|nr:hypothetical protein [Staphylococcus nepalensis]
MLFLTKDDVGYILNSLYVLQGLVTIQEVKNNREDKKENITKKGQYSGKPSSYSVQHINEQQLFGTSKFNQSKTKK